MRSYHGGAETYHVEVHYLKNGKQFKQDAPETADSLTDANKYYQRAIRLAFVEDYGQDEVWIMLFKYGAQVKFKAVKQKKSNPSGWIACKAVKFAGGKLLLKK